MNLGTRLPPIETQLNPNRNRSRDKGIQQPTILLLGFSSFPKRSLAWLLYPGGFFIILIEDF